MAGNAEMIDQVVSEEALKGLGSLSDKLTSSHKDMEKLLGQTQELSKELSKMGLSYTDVSKIVDKQTKLEKNYVEVTKEEARILREKEKLTKEIIATESEHYKAIERTRIELANKKKEVRDVIKEEMNLSNATKIAVKDLSGLNAELSKSGKTELIETAESQVKRLSLNLETAKTALDSLKTAPGLAESFEKDASGVTKFNEAISEGNIRMERLTYAQNIFADAQANGLITQDEYNNLMFSSNAIYEKQSQELKTLVAKRNEEASAIKTLSDVSLEAYNSMDASLKGYYTNLVEVQTELAANKQQQKELDDIYKNGTISLDTYTKNKVSLLAVERDLKTAEKENADLIKYTTQLVNSEVGSYKNLDAQYNLLKIKINQMGEAEGKNIKVKREMEKQANSLYKEMDKLQKLTGKHVLSVGNYKIATEDLTKTVSMLSPALGSVATGVAAVGKQFLVLLANPIVATVAAIVAVFVALKSAISFATDAAMSNEEQMYKLKEANSAIAVVSDKLTNSVLHPLADAWTKVANAIGEGLAKQLDWLGLTDDMVKKTQEYAQHERQRLDLAIYRRDTLIKNAKDEREIARLQAEAADKANISDEDRIKKLNEVDSLNNRIYARKKTTAVLEDNLLKAEATRTASSAEMNDKLAQSEANLINIDAERDNKLRQTNRLRQSSYNSQKKNLKDQETDLERYNKAMKKLEDENTKARIESQQLIFSKEADTQKAIITNDKKSYAERMDAANKFEEMMGNSINEAANKQIAGLQAQYDKDIVIAEKAGKTMLSFEEAYKDQITAIRAKQQQEINKITISGSKMREDIYKDSLEKQMKDTELAYNEINRTIDENESDALKKLELLHIKEKKNDEDYEKEKLKIQQDAIIQRMKAEMDYIDFLIDLYKHDPEKYAELQDKKKDALSKFHIFQNEAETQTANLNTKTLKEQIDKYANYAEKAKEFFSALNDLSSAMSAHELNRIEKESEASAEAHDEEIERIERLEESGAISKEQADARKKVVDDNEKARQDELEKRKIEIERAQAKRDKMIATFETIINTARAIGEANPVVPLMILAAATGAAQLATILAQPLPQYKDGTDSHPGGFALLGDGGRHEMIITPDNKMFMSPKVPTVMNLPKDTIVLPDYSEALLRMNMNIFPKERADGVTIFESVKQLEEIKGLKGNVARMNRSNNMGNEAIQRELIQINRRLGRQSLDNSINRRKMNN